MEIKKSVAVWLVSNGKILLQKRAATDMGKAQSNPGICQPTWNEKLETEEEPMDAIRRGALEELGKEFADAFDFSSLTSFDINEYFFGGKKFISYNFWGNVSEEQLKLVKLHSGAESNFIIVGPNNHIESKNNPNANPGKEIVLFEDQYQTLKKLFTSKKITV